MTWKSTAATYACRNTGTPADTDSVTGTDASKFSVDANGNVSSTGELSYLTQNSYNFIFYARQMELSIFRL